MASGWSAVFVSLKRVDGPRGLVGRGFCPCGQEICFAFGGLFHYELALARWQATTHDPSVSDGDLDFMFCVLGVKVRRWVIASIHSDDDAEEPTEFRHLRRPAGPA